MKTHLLSVPIKKTEETNWVKPLNNYLLSIYGNTSVYQQDLNNLEKLRQDIRGVNADNTGIRLYYKYYSQLELLDLRISFPAVNKHKNINFTWYDAFQPSISYKQAALAFEKANILFNLGTLLSKYATLKYEESQRNATATATDETFKDSLQYFQQAAGIYQFLNENFLHAPSNDLSQSTVKFLVKLMLAQSQEVFVLKVISGDMEQKKNSLIAKLCRSTSTHFEECFNMISYLANSEFPASEYTIVDADEEDFLEGSEQEGLDDNEEMAILDPSWISIINFKIYFYKSLAYYFNGLNLEANKKFGEAIAYMTRSSDILNEISSSILKSIAKSGSGDAYELLDNFKYQKNVIGIKLNDLNKDNDFIYHDIIPSTVTLPDIKPMDSAKIIPINQNPLFNEINDYNYQNFLNNVVPINIHELLSFYSEEKSQFLRNELDLVDVSNEVLSSVLEFLKMPKALVNLKSDFNADKEWESGQSEIDPVLLNYANEISTNYNKDLSNKEQILNLRKEIYDVISESESMLSNQVSESLTRFKDDLIKLKKSLYDATNSDNKLFGLINNDNSHLYGILCKGPSSSEFKQLFTINKSNNEKELSSNEISLIDVDDSQLLKSEDSVHKQIKSIEDILHDLSIIKANKAKLVETLKKEIHADDISDILILNSKIKSTNEIKTVIFAEEMKKFEPYNKELDKLIEKQKDLINNLKGEWDNLLSNHKVKEVQSSKKFGDSIVKDQTEKITRFYRENWKNFTDGLSKGVNFYSQLASYAKSLRYNIIAEVNKPLQRQPQPSFTDKFNNLNLNTNRSLSSENYAPAIPPRPAQLPQQIQRQYTGTYFASNRPVLPNQPPQQFIQPSSNISSADKSFSSYSYLPNANFGSYPGPSPELPPKGPSQNATHHQAQFQQTQQPFKPQSKLSTDSNKPDDLIYNQPSTYQPDMYNFFSNK